MRSPASISTHVSPEAANEVAGEHLHPREPGSSKRGRRQAHELVAPQPRGRTSTRAGQSAERRPPPRRRPRPPRAPRRGRRPPIEGARSPSSSAGGSASRPRPRPPREGAASRVPPTNRGRQVAFQSYSCVCSCSCVLFYNFSTALFLCSTALFPHQRLPCTSPERGDRL
jgi:hypothetical protein